MVQSMPKIAPSRKELQEIHRKLSTWEKAVDRSKKPRSRYTATIGWKGMAALLQYNIALILRPRVFLDTLIAREFSQEECRDEEARSGFGGRRA